MPIQRQERKDRVDLSERIPQPVGLEVNASQNVQVARRDPSRLLEALDRVSDVAGRKYAEYREEQDKLSLERGRLAGNTGEIDDELYEQNKAYRSGVDETKAKARSVALINDANESYAIESQKPGFNYEQWKSQWIGQMAGDADSLEQLRASNGIIARFNEVFDSRFSADEARRQVEELTESTYALAAETNRGGLFRSSDQVQQLITDATMKGMDDDEARAAVVAPIIASIAGGQTEKADLIRELVQGDPRLGPQFERAFEQGATLRKRQELDRNLELFKGLNEKIDTYSLTWEDGKKLVEDEVMPASQFAALMDRQENLRLSRLRQMQTENDKIQREAYLRQRIALGDFNALPKADRKDADKILDADFSQFTLAFRDAMRSGDTETAAMHAKSAAAWLNTHRLNGVLPQVMKHELESVNFNDPQVAKPTLEFARQLMRNGGDEYLRLGVGGAAFNRLEYYDEVVRSTGSVDEALAILSSRKHLTQEETAKVISPYIRELRNARREIEDPAASLQFDSYVNQYIAEFGMPVQAAIDKAKERVEKDFVDIDGMKVPNDMYLTDMPNGAPSAIKDYQAEVLRPQLETLGAVDVDGPIQLVPAGPKNKGKFYVMTENGFAMGRMTDDGKVEKSREPLVIDSSLIYQFDLGREDKAERDSQKAIQTFKTARWGNPNPQ